MKAASEHPRISLDRSHPVATIVLGEPSKRNAMGLHTWRAIPAMVAEAEDDPGIGLIVVRGAGKHFSSGNDIAELSSLRGDPAAALAFAKAMAEAMKALEDASKPLLMAIEGVCYGGAVALALTGDLRLASETATFAITPAKLGALYLSSDLHRLLAAVGKGQSHRMIYSARAVDAHEALRIGLVDEVIPDGGFESALRGLIDAILRGSPFTLGHTKQMLRHVGHGPAPIETAESLAGFVESTQSADFAEGIAAFLEKRTPRFDRSSVL